MAAGSFFDQRGGGAEYLCLPDEPEFMEFTPGQQDIRSKVYGAEYEISSDNIFFNDLNEFNVPCAACAAVERANKIMIPAKVTCPPTWTREYYGYLMSARNDFQRTSYECVVMNAEAIPGTGSDINGALFYPVEAVCHGIDCDNTPYEDGAELACVVCTK